MDYLYFLHGLFLLLLACAAIGIRRDVAFSIGLLAIFTLFHGLDILLRIPLLCCLPITTFITFVHLLFQVLAGSGLLYLACQEASRLWCRVLLIGVLAGIGAEVIFLQGTILDNLETAIVHATTFSGIVVAFLMWMHAKHVQYKVWSRIFAVVFAAYVSLSGYSYISGLLPGDLLEEIALNRQMLQLVFIGFVALLIVCLVIMGSSSRKGTRRNIFYVLWHKIGITTCAVLVTLSAGYWVAESVGHLSAQHFKTQLLDRVNIIKNMLDDDKLEALMAGDTPPPLPECV